MAVTMQQVKELRERTQAGLNDCKNALNDADGDIDKAIELILKKGLAKSAKRAGAVATEGEVATKVAADGKSGVIVEVNIQTDFAARNEDFKAFVNSVIDAAARAPEGADLGAQPLDGSTVEDVRKALVGKLGENINVRRWGRLAVEGAGVVHSYVHLGGKVATLLAVTVADESVLSNPDFTTFVDETAMQAAAMGPRWLKGDEVPDEEKAAQAKIFDAQLVEEGKPEQVRPKIIEGKIAKWVKENCLLESASVLQSDKTVDQVRQAACEALGTDVTITAFIRYERGEGVEKPVGKSFADEVTAMAGG